MLNSAKNPAELTKQTPTWLSGCLRRKRQVLLTGITAQCLEPQMAQISQIKRHRKDPWVERHRRMGTRPGRRVCASWGARMWRPGLTSGPAGSRRRRAHAGWVGAPHDPPLYPQILAMISPNQDQPKLAPLSSAPPFSSALKNAFALILVHPSYPRQKAFLPQRTQRRRVVAFSLFVPFVFFVVN